jgi:hypothetical protein
MMSASATPFFLFSTPQNPAKINTESGRAMLPIFGLGPIGRP